MFSFISKIFMPEKAPDQHPFYGERLVIDGHHFRLIRHHHDNSEIHLNDVDYITIYRFDNLDAHDRCWLNLRSYSAQALSVCTLAGNFAALERIVSQLPNFDVERYTAFRNAKVGMAEAVLWQKVHTADFAISPTDVADNGKSALDLLQQGLWLEHLNTLIAWGTYEDLQNNKHIKTQRKDFPNPSFHATEYCITKPTIFNGLKLHSLYTACDSAQGALKLHLPVIEYCAEISLGANRQKSFDAIKTHLDHFFQNNALSQIDYSVKDTWRVTWQVQSVSVELYCFYREMPDGWDNVAWLRIRYAPNLDRYYRTDYQRNLVLNAAIQYATFDFAIDLNANYRQVENAIYTPDCFKPMITEAQPLLIWHDTQQNVIGFADATLALIFNVNEVEKLTLAVQNFRGSEGRNGLEVHVQRETAHLGSVSNVANFKKNIKKITKLIGKEVSTYTYDEHY